jgi:hypothetical protein
MKMGRKSLPRVLTSGADRGGEHEVKLLWFSDLITRVRIA